MVKFESKKIPTSNHQQDLLRVVSFVIDTHRLLYCFSHSRWCIKAANSEIRVETNPAHKSRDLPKTPDRGTFLLLRYGIILHLGDNVLSQLNLFFQNTFCDPVQNDDAVRQEIHIVL